MKHTFIQKIVFLLVLFFSSVVLSHGTVIIPNVEHNKGYIDIKIYDSEDSFLKEDEAVEAVRKKANKGKAQRRFWLFEKPVPTVNWFCISNAIVVVNKSGLSFIDL